MESFKRASADYWATFTLLTVSAKCGIHPLGWKAKQERGSSFQSCWHPLCVTLPHKILPRPTHILKLPIKFLRSQNSDQLIYLNQPLKHVSQRQEGDEAVVLVWKNDFLQDTQGRKHLDDFNIWPCQTARGKLTLLLKAHVLQYSLNHSIKWKENLRLSLWGILQNLPLRFHERAWLPLGFLKTNSNIISNRLHFIRISLPVHVKRFITPN